MKVWYCWAFYRNFGNIGIYFIERLYIFLLKNKTGEQICMSEKNVFFLFWFIMLLLFAVFIIAILAWILILTQHEFSRMWLC